jgi:hypothetical protein
MYKIIVSCDQLLERAPPSRHLIHKPKSFHLISRMNFINSAVAIGACQQCDDEVVSFIVHYSSRCVFENSASAFFFIVSNAFSFSLCIVLGRFVLRRLCLSNHYVKTRNICRIFDRSPCVDCTVVVSQED